MEKPFFSLLRCLKKGDLISGRLKRKHLALSKAVYRLGKLSKWK